MTSRLTTSILFAGMLAAAAAGAQAEGLYVGGNVGTPDYSSSINGIGGDGGGDGASVNLYGGVQITPNFAVEAGLFDLGHTSDPGLSAKTYGVNVDAVGGYEFAPQWSLLGRVGLVDARFVTTNGDDASTGVKYGAGVQYDLTSQVAVRAEYDRYHFFNAFEEKPDIGQYSVGLKFGF